MIDFVQSLKRQVSAERQISASNTLADISWGIPLTDLKKGDAAKPGRAQRPLEALIANVRRARASGCNRIMAASSSAAIMASPLQASESQLSQHR